MLSFWDLLRLFATITIPFDGFNPEHDTHDTFIPVAMDFSGG
jgi:hypothetical protein